MPDLGILEVCQSSYNELEEHVDSSSSSQDSHVQDAGMGYCNEWRLAPDGTCHRPSTWSVRIDRQTGIKRRKSKEASRIRILRQTSASADCMWRPATGQE